MSKPDAFDPHARCVDQAGYSYRNVAARLKGEPDLEDRCNDHIARYIAQGQSEAWRREFRHWYDKRRAEALAERTVEVDGKLVWEGQPLFERAVSVKAHAAGFVAANSLRGYA